jgi:hypothetical protein
MDVTDGHPVFEPTLTPWKKCPEPGVEGFDFDYSPSEVRLRWGTAVRVIRSGRCIFGLNREDDLVAVGLIDMTGPEFGKLRLGVGPSLRGVPVSQLQDWQLSAVHAVLSEQLAGIWGPGTTEAFVETTQHANDVAREIERRRGSR